MTAYRAHVGQAGGAVFELTSYAWATARRADVQVHLIDGLRMDLANLEQAASALDAHGVGRSSTLVSYGVALAVPFLAEVLGYRREDVRLQSPSSD